MNKPSSKITKLKTMKPKPKYSAVWAKDIKPRAKKWLWEGHLLCGALELLTGIPGLGKSQVQIHYIACVSAGLKWPDGAKPIPPAYVIMLTAEDALDDEVIPRLLAAGANMDRVCILKKIRKDDKDRQFLLGEDLDELEQLVKDITEEKGEVGLITVDPITAYMGGKIDSHKNTEVRSQLGPLKDFSERLRICISAITHPAKNPGQRAIDHFIGSQAFIAAGRIGHVCVEELEEDEDGKKVPTGRILFANAKYSAHKRMPTLAYRMHEIVIGQDENTHENIATPHVVWDEKAVDITADQAVGASQGTGTGSKQKKRGEQDRVQAFLLGIIRAQPKDLLDGRQVVMAKDVIAEAKKKVGITEKQLATARDHLNIATKQTADGWEWWEGESAF